MYVIIIHTYSSAQIFYCFSWVNLLLIILNKKLIEMIFNKNKKYQWKKTFN